MKRLEDMSMDDLLRQYVRQLVIRRYRVERDEDTTEVLRKLDELGNRIIQLGGTLPKP